MPVASPERFRLTFRSPVHQDTHTSPILQPFSHTSGHFHLFSKEVQQPLPRPPVSVTVRLRPFAHQEGPIQRLSSTATSKPLPVVYLPAHTFVASLGGSPAALSSLLVYPRHPTPFRGTPIWCNSRRAPCHASPPPAHPHQLHLTGQRVRLRTPQAVFFLPLGEFSSPPTTPSVRCRSRTAFCTPRGAHITPPLHCHIQAVPSRLTTGAPIW